MKKEFVMRGQTESGQTEVLNFSGFKPGMAYKLISFDIYPSTSIGQSNAELSASITAGKTAISPNNPDFSNEGLIATTFMAMGSDATSRGNAIVPNTVINDTYLITQNLILMVFDTQSTPVNWQCKFAPVKMAKAEEAVTNYKQYLVSDGS